MGKWNYRRRWTPKNYYRDQRIPSPPTYYDTEFKLRGAWKNVELPWEERFCISVGIPWEKVVNAKKYMHCYDNVVKWNDSAGEEALCDAKKRFWAEINGSPADVPQPDPDMYTNEIDWNPNIDVELVKELDLAYFNPDEPQRVDKFDGAKRNVDNWGPGCILGLGDKDVSNIDDPWERARRANLNNSDSWADGKIWKEGAAEDDREIKDRTWVGGAKNSENKEVTWGGGSWHQKQIDSWQQKQNDSWGGGARNLENKETTWGGSAWHQNQNDRWGGGARNLEKKETTWGGGAWHQQQNDRWGGGGIVKERGWGSNRNGYGPRGRGPSRQRGDYGHREEWHGEGRHSNGSGWECRKREGSQQYTCSYKSARVETDDYREGNRYWR